MKVAEYADAIVTETLDSWERTGPHDEYKSSQYLWRLAVNLLELYGLSTAEAIGKCRGAGILMQIRPSVIEKTLDKAIEQCKS